MIDATRQKKDKFLLIIDTIPGGPADDAGVKPLDKIVEINGKPLEGLSTDKATAMLKGERQTSVHIKILRENHHDIIPLDIKRDVIKEQSSLCFYLPEQNIYYLSLNIFSQNATNQITDLFKQAQKKKYKALVLDLRNNSGGLLTSAIDIAGLFLDKGDLVVTTKDKTDTVTESYPTTRNPVTSGTLPIFILINNYTASAAEILSGCLKIHSDNLAQKAGNKAQKKLMVFLVGTPTFGKGSVQEVIPVSNNCAMKLTTSLYFLPNDISIQGVGVQPDFVIEKQLPQTEQMQWFTKFYGRERALDRYIKVDKNETGKKEDEEKTDTKKSWSERAREMLSKDNQFRGAITLINILDNAKKHNPELVNNRTKAIKYIRSNHITDQPLNLIEVKI